MLERGMKITNGMTLGGEIKTTMLRKGPLGARSTIRSIINIGKKNENYQWNDIGR